MEEHQNKQQKQSKKKVNQNSAAYLKQREKENARKRKFLDKMTPEQKEMKKVKDREYYARKKAENKTKTISDMSEREKRQQRKQWKKNSQKYREKKRMLTSILNNSPPASENEPNDDPGPSAVRAKLGRKAVKKDRSKAYRTIRKQKMQISKMQKKIDSLRKKLERKKRLVEREAKNNSATPNSKVNELVKDCSVTPEVRKKLLFGEVLSSQLQENCEMLPKNSKEREVFQKCVSGNLIKEYGLSKMVKPFLSKIKTNRNILLSDRKSPTFLITPSIRGKIISFFEKDDVSRMCPGKKDCLKGGKQKRLLLDTVKNLHPKFVAESGIQLSYATLLREKPYWVMQPRLKDRDTCLCVKHENFELKLTKLNRLGELKYNSTSELIKAYSCDVTSYACMFGSCAICRQIDMDPGNNEDTVEYFQWRVTKENRILKGAKKVVKLTKKVGVHSTVKDLRTSLLTDIIDMKKHVFGMNENLKEKREVKDNLTDTQIMIQIDFAENYMTKYGKEIQATHFGASKGQLSIHTGVFYVRNVDSVQTATFATVSNNLDHQAHAIWGHMKPILQNILSTREHVQTLHIFSDGPTSQYRNRTNIYLWIKTLLEHFPQITTATWTYSEPGHGKGPMDGVGGVLKKTADDYVLKGKDVKTAADFISVLKHSSVLLQEIPEDEIEAMKKLVPENVDPIPGIMNVSKITWQRSSDVSILLYQHSKFLKEIKLKAFASEERQTEAFTPELELGMEIPNDEELFHSLVNKQSIYNAVYSSSSSDDEGLKILSHQLRGHENANDVSTSCGLNKGNLHPSLIFPGTFLLINVPFKKNNVMYRYVAIADTTVDEDGEVKVTFLRCLRNAANMFRIDGKDVSYIAYEQIIKILPKPQLQKKSNRDYYYFEENIDILEK